MAKQISKAAFNLCVAHEVTSKAYYEKHYQDPEWPGLSSGVTVGIGYDLGQASRDKIANDWQGLVSPDMLRVMMSCSGHTGEAGKVKLRDVKSKISIPWDKALHVFANRDVPSWTAGVLQRVPNADKLSPSMLGVLFDTAYNRGHSWSTPGERYQEMRNIKQLVSIGNTKRVPEQYISMKRLWPKTAGLLRRCDDRAKLWEWALANMNSDTELAATAPTPPMPDASVPMKEGPARTKPPATTTSQNTTTAVIVAGGGAAAQQAHAMGLAGLGTALAMAAIAALVAGIVWVVWYRNRNPE